MKYGSMKIGLPCKLRELLSNLVFEDCGHAAIWSGLVVSIPSLNLMPVMTLAR